MQGEGEGFFFDDDQLRPDLAGASDHPPAQPATAPTAQPARRPPARQTTYSSVDPEGESALEEALAELESRGAPPLDDGAPQPPQRRGSCIECRAADGQQKFRAAFGLEVCWDCQKANRAEGGKFQVISKSKAKSEYLVTDSQARCAVRSERHC